MTSRMIVIKDDKPIPQIVLAGDAATIGRRSDCDISIKDPAVSVVHARIKKFADDYVIKDSECAKSLHISGKRVERQIHKSDHLTTIGEHKLKVMTRGGITVRNDVGANALVNKAKTASSAAGILRISRGY